MVQNHSTQNTGKKEFAASLANLNGFEKVNALIELKLSSENAELTEISSYLFSLGGKRIRPALTLMLGKAFSLSEPPSALIQIAAGIELIHMATLLHDDIIDKAPLRRKNESPFFKYGMAPSLLAGDFLLVRAFALCAHLDMEIIKETEKACVHLTEGELLEIQLTEKHATLPQSIEIAEKKTAALFSLAAFSAGHIAGLRAKEICLLREFGHELGIAFQILDDVLDITSDEKTLGKPPGTDIRERKPSYVNVLWLNSKDPRSEILLTPRNDSGEEPQIAELVHYLKGHKILEEAKNAARFHATKARECLNTVCQNTSLAQPDELLPLHALINYTLSRME